MKRKSPNMSSLILGRSGQTEFSWLTGIEKVRVEMLLVRAETFLLQAELSPSRVAKNLLATHRLPSSAKLLLGINTNEQWIWSYFPYRASGTEQHSHISWQKMKQTPWFCSLAATKIHMRGEIRVTPGNPQLIWEDTRVSLTQITKHSTGLCTLSFWHHVKPQNVGDYFYPAHQLLANNVQTADIKGHTTFFSPLNDRADLKLQMEFKNSKTRRVVSKNIRKAIWGGSKGLSSQISHCQGSEERLWWTVPEQKNHIAPTWDAPAVNCSKM